MRWEIISIGLGSPSTVQRYHVQSQFHPIDSSLRRRHVERRCSVKDIDAAESKATVNCDMGDSGEVTGTRKPRDTFTFNPVQPLLATDRTSESSEEEPEPDSTSMPAAVESPYFVGAQYHLDFASGTHVSTPPHARVRVTVLQTFEPFTVSPVLKVKLQSVDPVIRPPLPSTMILKLYDRRFAHDLRAFHDAPPLTHESEAQYRSFASRQGPTRSLAEWQSKRLADDETDSAPPPAETEAYLAALLLSYRSSEVLAYHRLLPLQGTALPRFFGLTQFALDAVHPHTVDPSVPGILLDFIAGTTLSDLPPRGVLRCHRRRMRSRGHAEPRRAPRELPRRLTSRYRRRRHCHPPDGP
ncbi:hypothetical protein EW146_g10236 [Bondarzewia mesenterica]|uniref:Uncharacterized protein n=1 Tax=Bondarzewia mesenterica TaxID=1095465 RepID=A0A4S4L100_9AGAM|nr:hypothetical protein EW146_g10236 [Bondarzewia mesenterica]